jgi:sugar lactone lactonase YvrE
MIKNGFLILIVSTLFLVLVQITMDEPIPVLSQTTGGNNQTGIEYVFVTKWGTLGDQPGQFDGQNSVAGSGDSIYVADYYNERMQMFTPDGEFVKMWGGTYGEGDGEFKKPHGVAVDSEGNVYVSERSGLRIQKFDSEGNFVTKWGSEGTADGQFGGLESLDVDSEGNVYVADSGNERIQKFTPDGQFILSWGTPGSEPGQFDEPGGVAIDSDDNVFVTDIENHRIQVFTSDGQFITQIGSNEASNEGQESDSELITPSGSSTGTCCSEGTADGQFNQPEGLDVGPDNRVIVADTGNNRIQIFEQSPAL